MCQPAKYLNGCVCDRYNRELTSQYKAARQMPVWFVETSSKCTIFPGNTFTNLYFLYLLFR